jgi:hypothetical protein
VDRAVAELHQGAGRGYDPIAVAALENVGAAEMAWLMNLKDFQPSTRDLLGRA